LTSVFESNSLTAESAPGRGNFTPFDVRGGFGSVVVFWGNQCKHYTVPNTTGVSRVSLDFRVCPMSLFDRTSTYVLGGFYAHMDAAGRVTRGGPRGDNDGNSGGHGSGGNGDRDGDSGAEGNGEGNGEGKAEGKAEGRAGEDGGGDDASAAGSGGGGGGGGAAPRKTLPDTLASPIVINNGSGFLKAGLAGGDAPQVVIPCVATRTRGESHHGCRPGGSPGVERLVGDLAVEESKHRRGAGTAVTLYHPIHGGIVTDWDLMETVWRHTFVNELRVDPEDHPVLLTEPPLNPQANRERMTQIMFETFNVAALYVSQDAVLSVYACERRSGLAVQSGDTVTYIVPVFEGCVLFMCTYSVFTVYLQCTYSV
jgi:hypothetical protein